MLRRLIAPVVTIAALVAAQLGVPIDDDAQRQLVDALTILLGVGGTIVTALQPSIRGE